MMGTSGKISLRDDEIKVKYILASGPGGQNVNKVATAAQLRFNIKDSPSITDDVKERLIRLAGKKVTVNGELIITARRYRSQERNRQDAIDRLVDLIERAATKLKPHKKIKLSLAARQRRLENKQRRARKKQLRQAVREW